MQYTCIRFSQVWKWSSWALLFKAWLSLARILKLLNFAMRISVYCLAFCLCVRIISKYTKQKRWKTLVYKKNLLQIYYLSITDMSPRSNRKPALCQLATGAPLWLNFRDVAKCWLLVIYSSYQRRDHWLDFCKLLLSKGQQMVVKLCRYNHLISEPYQTISKRKKWWLAQWKSSPGDCFHSYNPGLTCPCNTFDCFICQITGLQCTQCKKKSITVEFLKI